MGGLKSDLSSLCSSKWASMRGNALLPWEEILLWITTGKRLDVFWILNMKADVGSDTSSSRLWILPEACREPIRSVQVVAHLAKCENYFFSGNLVSKALGGEKKSSSSGVARCIFPLWTCSKFCSWMSTVLLGVTLVLPCLPPCTYPTLPFLLNLIQGCSSGVACECDEMYFLSCSAWSV